MMPRIFAYISQHPGSVDENALQLAAVAKLIDASAPLTAIVTGVGPKFEETCKALRTVYQEVWRVSHASLARSLPEPVAAILPEVLPKESIVLLAHDTTGIDVGPGLSIKMGAAYVADIVGVVRFQGTNLTVVCQEFGGQFNTHVSCDVRSGAVITVRAGAFKTSPPIPLSGVILDKSIDKSGLSLKRRYLETVARPAGDIDITKYDVLVSIGRGIQKPENIALAEELAESLGAAVSCSRPVVDAKWLDKSRQVGSSGTTVKPKVYLACGISGQFQHLAGLKGSPFIIAINKNAQAPIFQVADVGIVADILELLPEITQKAREGKLEKSSVGAR